MNDIWTEAYTIERNYLESVSQSEYAIKKNIPVLDSLMFVKHNIRDWTEPQDFMFQPSLIWHDDEEMITDEVSINYLRNKFKDIEIILGNLKLEVATKVKEVESLKKTLLNLRKEGQSDIKIEGKLSDILKCLQDLSLVDNKRLTADTQVLALQEWAGDILSG